MLAVSAMVRERFSPEARRDLALVST